MIPKQPNPADIPRSPLSPEIIEWARQTIDMDDFMAQVREIESTGGRELKDFIADIEAAARTT